MPQKPVRPLVIPLSDSDREALQAIAETTRGRWTRSPQEVAAHIVHCWIRGPGRRAVRAAKAGQTATLDPASGQF